MHFWIAPARCRLPPGYEQREFPLALRRAAVTLLASGDGRDGSVTVHQDVSISSVVLKPRERVSHELEPERHAWVQVVSGSLELNGLALASGDGAAISDEIALPFASTSVSEALLFDLA
jgi:quercetin 2,3-dioxygenase